MITFKNQRVRFYDLSEDFQSSLLEQAERMLRLEAIAEGCNLIKNKKFENCCWQEAYCRDKLIGAYAWNEESIVAKTDDEFWEDLLTEEISLEASNLLNKYFVVMGDVELG